MIPRFCYDIGGIREMLEEDVYKRQAKRKNAFSNSSSVLRIDNTYYYRGMSSLFGHTKQKRACYGN